MVRCSARDHCGVSRWTIRLDRTSKESNRRTVSPELRDEAQIIDPARATVAAIANKSAAQPMLTARLG